jgi:hypothetical protein
MTCRCRGRGASAEHPSGRSARRCRPGEQAFRFGKQGAGDQPAGAIRAPADRLEAAIRPSGNWVANTYCRPSPVGRKFNQLQCKAPTAELTTIIASKATLHLDGSAPCRPDYLGPARKEFRRRGRMPATSDCAAAPPGRLLNPYTLL